MKIIAVKTLKTYCEKYPQAKQSLLAWHQEVAEALWSTPNELKDQYRNVSVISSKRVVFNIHGNSFRLIADFEFRLKIAFVVWFGTHKEYDQIDVKTINYDSSYKNQ